MCWHVATATQTLTNWISDLSEEREDVRIDDNVNTEAEELPSTRSNEDVREGHSQGRAANGSADCRSDVVVELGKSTKSGLLL